jgi:hypothetical protein
MELYFQGYCKPKAALIVSIMPANEEGNLDQLLNQAFEDLKNTTKRRVNNSPHAHGMAEVEKLVEEFSIVSTSNTNTDGPEKIDSAIEKLLQMVFIFEFYC